MFGATWGWHCPASKSSSWADLGQCLVSAGDGSGEAKRQLDYVAFPERVKSPLG